jgi:hypothetical protein
VTRGFAVNVAGPRVPKMWVFFTAFEPALAFGRAARMAVDDISSYGVLQALRVIEWSESARCDVPTLYTTGDNLDRQPNEKAALQRWLSGIDNNSSRFQSVAQRRSRPGPTSPAS